MDSFYYFCKILFSPSRPLALFFYYDNCIVIIMIVVAIYCII